MRLGPNIRALLDKTGMNQRQLAERACLSEQYLSIMMNHDTSPSPDLLRRIAAVLGTSLDGLINPEGNVMQGPKSDGHVKVLMSCRFNNFEASRPLAPGASDAEYDVEFDRAMQTVQRALDKFEKLTDDRTQFNALCEEYEYLLKVEEQTQSRDLAESPVTDIESEMLSRLALMRSVIKEYKHPLTWDNLLSREAAEPDLWF